MYLLFAWRYFKAKKSTNAINLIAWISTIAIMVITMFFIILMSVFNGFEGLVKSLYSTFYSDLRIIPRHGRILKLSDRQLIHLKSIEGIRNYSLVIEEKILLQNGEVQIPVFLKGVDSNYTDVTQVADKLIKGTFELGSADQPAVILGSGIENALAIESDRNIYPLTAYLFRRGVNINVIDPYQAFAAENVVSAGTFFIQQDIDNKYAITNVAFMKRMMNLKPDEFGSIEIALRDQRLVNSIKTNLQKLFPPSYIIETRYEQNKSLYNVMTLEKWAIYGILTLMLIVAAFTMVGALTMLVLEKQKDIQVLKAMGAARDLVQKIFLSEGLLLASIGTVCGLFLGMLVCWAQVKYKLVPIQGGTFLIDYYPVKMMPMDFIFVIGTVIFVAFFASWFPSRKAAMQAIELKT